MKCPTDDTVLVMSERSGIEIDYCPQCRGVWLDRGELDKIIDRATVDAAPRPAAPGREYDSRSRDDSGFRQGDYQKKRKREHWLSELFD